MIEVNAMGQACPIPVIMAKKAVRENTGKENILVKVDNEVATQNLSKMAAQLGIGVEVNKVSEKEFTVLLKAKDGVNLKPVKIGRAHV